jgi:hypothetical protein
MSAPAVDLGRPTLRIGGSSYPVLLPTLRDARLHLAAVIISLQVLGQVAFDFDLSIAQILIAIGTSAVLEVAIAFRRQRVIMWPASALLTGNGVAFILRVPGTEHGDWWSLNGWWIFAGTAAVSLLSKYLIRYRGRHVFNPSNIGLVLCFLVLGSDRAEPLDFWWGPMTAWMALALAIIVAGGFAILLCLRLLGIAVSFWLAFVAGIGVLAASGHAMTARWHLGPVSDGYFWWVLAFSPEVLVFLFFMITDPKTVPSGSRARLVYAVGVALLATLLIAPQTTEFGAKVALLGALAIVCGLRPVLDWLLRADRSPIGGVLSARLPGHSRLTTGGLTLAVTAGFAGLVVLAGIPARSGSAAAAARPVPPGLPRVTVTPSHGVASQISRPRALQIARDVVADLQVQADGLRRRDTERVAVGAAGAWLGALRRQIRAAAGGPIAITSRGVERMSVTLERGDRQRPPRIVATLSGSVELDTYAAAAGRLVSRSERRPFQETLELALKGGRYVIVASRGLRAHAAATR